MVRSTIDGRHGGRLVLRPEALRPFDPLQVMHDLLDASQSDWTAERAKLEDRRLECSFLLLPGRRQCVLYDALRVSMFAVHPAMCGPLR